jgi:ABC-2 type transport system permease protein
MSALVAMFAARFGVLLQYRAAALAGLATQVFWGFVRVAIFAAFYRASTVTQPMPLEQVITYVWLTQALLLLLPWRYDAEIEAMVRSGSFAYELLRPVDVYLLWYARALAQRTAPALLRSVPMVVLAVSLLDMGVPASPAAAIAFVVSLVAAVLLSSSITALLSVSLLFTTSGKGVNMLSSSLINVFSGSLVPLALLPGWLATTAELLPFRGLLDTPFSIYLGRLAPSHAAMAIAHQLLWTAALVLLGRWMLARAATRVTVQGG